jgi:hypothetical protein
MNERESGGLELAWILWAFVAALFLTFGVAELVSFRHTVSFWLVGGLVGASCSILALAFGLRGGRARDTLAPAMGDVEPENGGETAFAASDDTKGVVVDAALALAETQLLAQIADEASLDGRATGLVGFNGALLAAIIAAKELIGGSWLVAFFVVIGVILLLLVGLYDGRGDLQRKPPRSNIGADAALFYEEYGAGSPLDARERLLKDLARDVDKNAKRIRRKGRWLQVATLVLVVGLATAGFLIETDRSTKMEEPCPLKGPTHQSLLASSCRKKGQGSIKSGQAAQSPKANGRGNSSSWPQRAKARRTRVGALSQDRRISADVYDSPIRRP